MAFRHPPARPWAALLLALLLPTVALADARIEAKRHFRRGMALIASRDYEEGIRELKEAYAIRPHANVLFNIAKAYEDAGKPVEALDYYRRYLETRPRDGAAVARRIDDLEDSLPPEPAPTSPPPERTAQRPPPSANGAGAGAGDASVDKLAALTERLEKALTRVEALEKEAATAATPAPGTDGAPVGTAPALTPEQGDRPYEESVITASRRAQSTLEAPNATTIITAEEIRLSGARSIPDLLRRVPGAEVMQMGVGSANVSLRGFQQRLSNKVLVLLDGRTEYQDFLGVTLWSSLPVGLEDIERIEVIRGPGSALYGANAMLGVINIITKAPGQGPRTEVTGFAGSGNSLGASTFASAGDGPLRYRASAGYEQADKWSRDYDDGRPDVLARSDNPNLGLRSARGSLTASYAFSNESQLSVGAGVNRLFTEVYPLGLLRNFQLDGLVAHTRAGLDAGPMRLRLFWNHFDAEPAPQYDAVGQRSLASNLSSHLFDAELILSQTLQLAGEHRIEVGVNGRIKRVSWPEFQGPLREELHAAAFIQDEWRIVDPFRVVVSYRVDRHPLLDGGSPGYAQSPRVSALYFLAEEHVLRASASTAFREPTFLESYLDVRIPVPGVNGASALTQGSTSLEPESLVSYELGYRGESATLGLEWDLTLYQNTVKNLISISGLQPLPASQSFDAQSQTYLLGRSVMRNEPAVYNGRGIEVGMSLSPVDRLTLRSSAAFQQIEATGLAPGEPCGPCTQAPAVKLAGAVTFRTLAGVDFQVDGSYTSSTTWIEREPAAADPTQIVSLANPLEGYAIVSGRIGYRMLDDKLTVALSGSHLGSAHSQHPFGNLIERRLYTTVTVTP